MQVQSRQRFATTVAKLTRRSDCTGFCGVSQCSDGVSSAAENVVSTGSGTNVPAGELAGVLAMRNRAVYDAEGGWLRVDQRAAATSWKAEGASSSPGAGSPMAGRESAENTAGDEEADLDGTAVQDEAARDRARAISLSGGQPPTTLPGYRILRQIGEGKYGTVWLARELNTGKHVAIKFYTHRRGVDWSLLGREVEKLAVLYTSRNIVGLLSVGWDHDPPYYVMEYLPNGSLATRLEQGTLPTVEAVRVATRVCQALVHAHGSGILHCDLKPANVLLDQDQEPRLCDFGQSRLADEQSHALGKGGEDTAGQFFYWVRKNYDDLSLIYDQLPFVDSMYAHLLIRF
ncbi:MAG TPA: serine/threonine-protein kinase, partial [Planctomycetaceae bacterium]|nr:serine/threonine-protein kinase [Planctomycetaceae bacterium]